MVGGVLSLARARSLGGGELIEATPVQVKPCRAVDIVTVPPLPCSLCCQGFRIRGEQSGLDAANAC